MNKTILIMAGFEGKQEREALRVDSKKEATTRLNKAFKRVDDNLWVDSMGQEFSIVEKEG